MIDQDERQALLFGLALAAIVIAGMILLVLLALKIDHWYGWTPLAIWLVGYLYLDYRHNS